ncbi:MAG TPA: hypothetical protein VGB50_10885 [Flavobacterium sp.]|jgi:hypothetical protein
MNKPINTKMHGIIDYAMGSALAVLPAALGLGPTAVKSYMGIAGNILAMNAMTDSPVGMKKVMSVKAHRNADIATLGGLALMTMAKPFRKDRKALYFHLGFLSLALAEFLLTDFNSPEENLVSAAGM